MGLFFTLLNFALCIGIILVIFNFIKNVKNSINEIAIMSEKIDVILKELKK